MATIPEQPTPFVADLTVLSGRRAAEVRVDRPSHSAEPERRGSIFNHPVLSEPAFVARRCIEPQTAEQRPADLDRADLDRADLDRADPDCADPDCADPLHSDPLLANTILRHALAGAGEGECEAVEPTAPNKSAQRGGIVEPHRPTEPAGIRLGESGGPLSEFGPLLQIVSDPAVTDVFVNGANQLWVDRGGALKREPSPWRSEQSLREFVVRLVASGGRHVDEANPCIDVRLHNGIRVHAVLPPVSTSGTLLSVRLPSVKRLALTDLALSGFFSVVGLEVIRGLVRERANILISGAGGTGKTTLLAAILSSAPQHDRIIAIEDVAELQVDHEHFVALESRQPNLEGAGAVGLDRLVREALRMRPDRLVVGECRGAEVSDLLAALNTGHDGGAGTVHANSLDDVPARLEALGALAGLSPTALARQAVSAIGAVLHLDRVHGQRRLTQMGRFALGPTGRLRMLPFGDGPELDDSGRNSLGNGAPERGGYERGRRESGEPRRSDAGR